MEDAVQKIARLILEAKRKVEPSLEPWERAIKNNPYAGHSFSELLELLSTSREDWRLVVQACAWSGRNPDGTN